jgi:hypothetical protein
MQNKRRERGRNQEVEMMSDEGAKDYTRRGAKNKFDLVDIVTPSAAVQL